MGFETRARRTVIRDEVFPENSSSASTTTKTRDIVPVQRVISRKGSKFVVIDDALGCWIFCNRAGLLSRSYFSMANRMSRSDLRVGSASARWIGTNASPVVGSAP